MIVATNISNLERLLFAGLVDLPWWGYILVALGLTHMTIIAVTLFLHRHQTHRALDLHPSISHFFRMWLWLTTGMVTKQWVAVHRKHHAKVESEDDPHSPQRLGLNRVLWTGVLLYVDASKDQALVERYGYGTPNDWMERTIYSKYSVLGLTIVGLLDVVLFGFLPGTLIFMTQIAWIPFWAAGVINGVGHYWGYRNWRTNDASSNMVPWGVVIGGEELHNNHHAFPTSAKFSTRWYEFDIGWMYVRLLQVLGLATVRRLALGPKFGAPRATPDLAMLNAIIRSRYDVMAHYERMFNRVLTEEVLALSSSREHGDESLKSAKHLLLRDEAGLTHAERPRVAALLRDSHSLSTLYGMRAQLTALWARSLMPSAALVSQLQLWCDSAEASGVSPLVKFSRHLRSYS
jgi:stearoyl-CoA desaturase (delta-9 desaturase)